MNPQLTRRRLLVLAAAAPAVEPQSLRTRMPAQLPPGVAAVLARLLGKPPSSLNTDWFGTMPLVGALLWRRRGIAEVEPFAKAWLAHHLAAKEVAKYSGNRSRTVMAGGVPVTTYAGHFGISQVCEEMFGQFREIRARQIALDMADIILHRTARNRVGLIGHDDTADFAIPDVTFFVVASLMIAARMSGERGLAYQDQALYQLRTSIDTFLMKDTGLAKTLYRSTGVGKTYWTRASGWLLWSITAMLRRLAPNHAAFAGFTADLKRLVDGMIRVQQPNGGFHILLDDPATPLDATGPAMFAWGVHESARRGWLPAGYRAASERAWDFVKANLTDDGVLRNTYYPWALPAENGDVRVHDETQGWAMGFVLGTAAEMTL